MGQASYTRRATDGAKQACEATELGVADVGEVPGRGTGLGGNSVGW